MFSISYKKLHWIEAKSIYFTIISINFNRSTNKMTNRTQWTSSVNPKKPSNPNGSNSSISRQPSSQHRLITHLHILQVLSICKQQSRPLQHPTKSTPYEKRRCTRFCARRTRVVLALRLRVRCVRPPENTEQQVVPHCV